VSSKYVVAQAPACPASQTTIQARRRGRHVKGGSLMTFERCASRFPVTSIWPLLGYVLRGRGTSPGFASAAETKRAPGEGVRSSTQPWYRTCRGRRQRGLHHCPGTAGSRMNKCAPKDSCPIADDLAGPLCRNGAACTYTCQNTANGSTCPATYADTYTCECPPPPPERPSVDGGAHRQGERFKIYFFHQSGGHPALCGHVHVHPGSRRGFL